MDRSYCRPCDEWIDGAAAEMIEHIRLLHPDAFVEVERWPDGDVVVVDRTLEPEEFEQEDQ